MTRCERLRAWAEKRSQESCDRAERAEGEVDYPCLASTMSGKEEAFDEVIEEIIRLENSAADPDVLDEQRAWESVTTKGPPIPSREACEAAVSSSECKGCFYETRGHCPSHPRPGWACWTDKLDY